MSNLDRPEFSVVSTAPLGREELDLLARIPAMPVLVDMYDALQRQHQSGEPMLRCYFGRPVPGLIAANDLWRFVRRHKVPRDTFAAGIRIVSCLWWNGVDFTEWIEKQKQLRNSGMSPAQVRQEVGYFIEKSIIDPAAGKRTRGPWEKHREHRVTGMAACGLFEWAGGELVQSTVPRIHLREDPTVAETMSESEWDSYVEKTHKTASRDRRPKEFHNFFRELIRWIDSSLPLSEYPSLPKIDDVISDYRNWKLGAYRPPPNLE